MAISKKSLNTTIKLSEVPQVTTSKPATQTSAPSLKTDTRASEALSSGNVSGKDTKLHLHDTQAPIIKNKRTNTLEATIKDKFEGDTKRYIKQNVLGDKTLEDWKKETSKKDKKALIDSASTIELKRELCRSLGLSEKEMITSEDLVVAYAEKLGNDASIDDVIATLKKKPENERTEDEKQIVSYLNGKDIDEAPTSSAENLVGKIAEKPDNSGHSINLEALKTSLKKNSKLLQNLVSEEEKKSDEWKNKTPLEKLETRLDRLCARTIEGYSQMSDEQKLEKRAEMVNSIGGAFDKNWKNLSNTQRVQRIAMVATATETLEKNNISLADVITGKIKPDKVYEKAKDYIGDQITSALTPEDLEKIKSEPAEKQLEIITAKGLEKIFPEYKAMLNDPTDEEETNRAIAEFTESLKETFVDTLSSSGQKKWSELTNGEKELRIQAVTTKLAVIAEYNTNHSTNAQISLSDYKKLSLEERYQMHEDYEDAHGIKIPEYEKTRRKVSIKLNKENPTDAEIRKYIGDDLNKTHNIKADKFLTRRKDKFGKVNWDAIQKDLESYPKDVADTILARLKDYNRITIAEEKFGKKYIQQPRANYTESIEYTIESKYNGNFEEYFKKEILKGRSIDEVQSTLGLKGFRELISQCSSLQNQVALCLKFRVDPQKIIPDNMTVLEASRALSEQDSKTLKLVTMCGKPEIVNATTTALAQMTDVNNKTDFDNWSAYAIDVASNRSECASHVAKTNNKYIAPQSIEAAMRVNTAIVTSKNVSDDTKAEYTAASLSTASCEVQHAYIEGYRQINDVNVTKGMAAASDSIYESNRNYYNESINYAIKTYNYSSEQVAEIRTAQATGSISSSSNSSKTDSSSTSSTKTSSSSSSASTQQTQAPTTQQQNKTTAQASTKGASTTPQATNTTPKAQTSTPSLNNSTTLTASTSSPSITSSLSRTSNQEHTETSKSKETAKSDAKTTETKKAKAMENAAKTEKEIKEAVKTWEAEHNTKISEEEQELITDAVVIQMLDEVSVDNTILPASTKEKLESASSINERYQILLEDVGSIIKTRFVEYLANSGSTNDISSFVTSNKDLTKKIYQSTTNTAVKKILLDRMTSNEVISVVDNMSSEDAQYVIKNKDLSGKQLSELIKAGKISLTEIPHDKLVSTISLLGGANSAILSSISATQWREIYNELDPKEFIKIYPHKGDDLYLQALSSANLNGSHQQTQIAFNHSSDLNDNSFLNEDIATNDNDDLGYQLNSPTIASWKLKTSKYNNSHNWYS